MKLSASRAILIAKAHRQGLLLSFIQARKQYVTATRVIDMATKGKSGVLLKVSVTSSRILEIGQNGIKTEQSGKGTITGRYRGTHWDTLEVQMNSDDTSTWEVKFLQMTDKGEMLVGTGSGTMNSPNSRGIAKGSGSGTIMTQSQRLAELNGGWNCEFESNLRTDKAVVKVKFE